MRQESAVLKWMCVIDNFFRVDHVRIWRRVITSFCIQRNFKQFLYYTSASTSATHLHAYSHALWHTRTHARTNKTALYGILLAGGCGSKCVKCYTRSIHYCTTCFFARQPINRRQLVNSTSFARRADGRRRHILKSHQAWARGESPVAFLTARSDLRNAVRGQRMQAAVTRRQHWYIQPR